MTPNYDAEVLLDMDRNHGNKYFSQFQYKPQQVNR